VTPPPAPGPHPPDRLRGLPVMVCAQVSLHAASTGMRIVGPLLLLRSGAPAWQVGLLLACFGLGPVGFAWPVGRVVDRRGYPPAMSVVLALAALAGVLSVLASLLDGAARLGLLCAAAAAAGGAANAGMVVAQRTAARMAPDPARLRGAFAWVGVAPPVANLLGPVAAGAMFDAAGATVALAGLLGFVVLAVALVRLARTPAVPVQAARADAPSPIELLRHPTVRRMMLVDLLITGGWDIHGFIVPTLGHARGLSATAIGTVFGLFAAGVAAVRAAIPWLAHRLRESSVLTGALVASGAIYAIYPLGESAAYMGACALALGVAIGAAQPMVLSAIHQAVDERQRGGVLALRTMWVGLGSVTVPIGLAAAVAAIGPSAMLWAVGAAVAAGSAAARPRR
jgi:MFS family permease